MCQDQKKANILCNVTQTFWNSINYFEIPKNIYELVFWRWKYRYWSIKVSFCLTTFSRLWMRALVLLCESQFCFLKFLDFLHVFHELMNQYQACLYLSECISHDDFKLCHEIPKCWHFWQFCDKFELLSAHACRVQSINTADGKMMEFGD